MQFGIYSQWYDPEPGPAALPGIYARELSARGHAVRVLTGFPNYPAGRLYDGYLGHRPVVEYRDRIAIRRVPLIPSHSGSAAGRVANYLSFAASAGLLNSRAFKDSDAFWVYNSPATVGIPLLLRKRKTARPFLLHVQDLWPESVVHSGMMPGGRFGALAESLLHALVARVESAADHIAVISPSVQECLIGRGVPLAKVSYVPNPTDEGLFYPRTRDPAVRRKLGGEDDVVIMYGGNLGHVQALDLVIDAMALLRDHPEIKLVLVGSGIAEAALRDQVARLGLTSVRFHGRVPPGDVPDLMAAADVQLVSLRADPFLAMTIPSKIQAILASAQPILGVLEGDGAAVIRQAGAGLVCSPGNPADIAAALLDLAGRDGATRRLLGRAGYDHYRLHMSAGMAGDAVEKLLIRMAQGD